MRRVLASTLSLLGVACLAASVILAPSHSHKE